MKIDLDDEVTLIVHCPSCHSHEVIKNGFNATNKQMYRCKKCERQLVLNPDKSPISAHEKDLIDKWLNINFEVSAKNEAINYNSIWRIYTIKFCCNYLNCCLSAFHWLVLHE
jgi:transposase-like protein